MDGGSTLAGGLQILHKSASNYTRASPKCKDSQGHVRATTFLLFDTFVQLLDGPDPRNQAMRPSANPGNSGDAHGNTLSFGRAAMVSGHKARDHNESAVRSRCPSARRWCARRRPQGVCPTWRTWSGEDRFSDVRIFQIHVVCVHTSLCSRMCSLRA